MSQTRRVEDEVKDGDVVTDGQGNEFILVKRINRAQGSTGDQQALIQTMRRLATFFRLLGFIFIFGLVFQVAIGLFTNIVGMVFYTLMSFAMSVVLKFLANLGERIEGIYKHLAKQATRAAVNQ